MKRILAADDSRTILQMVAFTLKGAGYEVVEASDGQAALNLAKAQAFDLVITDLNMPALDGIALTKQLRGLMPYRFTPILMLTTEAGEHFRDRGKAAGATGWLVKPFDPAKLLGVVKKLIG